MNRLPSGPVSDAIGSLERAAAAMLARRLHRQLAPHLSRQARQDLSRLDLDKIVLDQARLREQRQFPKAAGGIRRARLLIRDYLYVMADSRRPALIEWSMAAYARSRLVSRFRARGWIR